MTDAHYRLPNEVANHLQISPSTLRRWSNEFADYLSETAGRPQPEAGGRQSHRRYTDQDLETLMAVKGLLAEGQTYVQVARRLEALRLRHAEVDADVIFEDEDEDAPTTALGPTLQEYPYTPAVSVLSDTLHTVADGQQLLLGSQQANREMLSVVLQDNFNLKEENAKLRDRMLDLERDLNELRRLDDAHRETLEVRLQQLEDEVRYRPHPQPQPQRAQRQGCLSSLFGPMG